MGFKRDDHFSAVRSMSERPSLTQCVLTSKLLQQKKQKGVHVMNFRILSVLASLCLATLAKSGEWSAPIRCQSQDRDEKECDLPFLANEIKLETQFSRATCNKN